MNSGKSKSSLKTREPYGKVTEIGQVPIALQEVQELALGTARIRQAMDEAARLKMVEIINGSIIAVTCANPGCLSQMAENMEVQA